MSLVIEKFDVLEDKRQVHKVKMQGSGGLYVSLLTYGATINNIIFEGKDVILGYDKLSQYVNDNGTYQGATIGRYANRIAEGKFTLNGKTYDVGCNEKARGHLHGGIIGFDKKIWEAEILESGDEPSVKMSCVSEDGEEGYPGKLDVSVIFTVTKDNTLRISYSASADKDTVINLTNHAYFNLNGYDGGDILDTKLSIFADAITPVDELLIPTGEIMSVDNTAFDFREGKEIGKDINDQHPQMIIGGGFDHNFILGEAMQMKHAVSAVSPKSGIKMDCYTDQPAVQLYTSNFLKSSAGKGGINLYQHQGFCLETQHYPDSPNHDNFPSTVLHGGETFKSVTEYKFSK